LRPTEKPVEHKGVGVGRHIRRDPGDQPCEADGQGLSEAKDSLEACECDLPLLPKPSLLCPLGNQQEPHSAKLPFSRRLRQARSPSSLRARGSPLNGCASARSSSVKPTSVTLAGTNSAWHSPIYQPLIQFFPREQDPTEREIVARDLTSNDDVPEDLWRLLEIGGLASGAHPLPGPACPVVCGSRLE
jgi:hypothetical protein